MTRQREAHPAPVSVREDGEAAGEAGEWEWVARVPETGAQSEHDALLLHLCITIMSLVCESKVQIASVIEGRSCPGSPGVGTQTWLANSANCRDSRAGPGRRGLTGPDLQTAADTRHGLGPLSSSGVLTADHKMSAMGRTDQSLGFSCSVLKISLCILHTGDRGSVTGDVRYLASTRSLSEEYPRVLESCRVAILQQVMSCCLRSYTDDGSVSPCGLGATKVCWPAKYSAVCRSTESLCLCLARLPGSGPVCRNCTRSPGPGCAAAGARL